MENLKYPAGRFSAPESYTPEFITECIQVIDNFPQQVRSVCQAIGKERLLKHYRPEGWTGVQVVHHLADSHVNAYIRFKLALTENNPCVKPYDEQLWAMLADANDPNIEPSLQLLEGVHHKWAQTLKCMDDKQFDLTYFHPTSQKSFPLKWVLALYTSHSKNHLGHLQLL